MTLRDSRCKVDALAVFNCDDVGILLGRDVPLAGLLEKSVRWTRADYSTIVLTVGSSVPLMFDSGGYPTS